MTRKRIFMIYKQHAVCFHCRVALKDITECPHCRQPMIQVGANFKAPRRQNIREWEQLYRKYAPRIKAHPEWFKVRLTHSDEYENEVASQHWGTYWWNVRFSRKLTPRKTSEK